MRTEADWQAMDSAPKDGTPFLLLCEHGHRNHLKVTAKWIGGKDGWWQDVEHGSCVGVFPGGRNEATAKWKPLPPPDPPLPATVENH